MRKYIFLLGLFLIFANVKAQSTKGDIAGEMRLATLPLFDDNKIGGELNIRYYFTNELSAGIDFAMTGKRFSDGFGFNTDRTVVNYFAVTVPLQFNIVNTKNFQFGFGLNTGIGVATLMDRNNHSIEQVWNDELLIFEEREVRNKLANDTYFNLTPNVNVMYRLFDVSNDGVGIYLSGSFGKQAVFGNGSFTNSSDFNGYVGFIGVAIKGPSKSKM